MDTNITGTLNLLEAARLGGVGRFIFASSSSVYGLAQTMPFREDMPLLETISPYAATKLAGEQLCANYAHLYGIRVACLRFFNAYGPRLRPDLAIYQFTSRIHRGQAIDVFGDGSMRRDFTYIDDTIQGVLAALRHLSAPDGPDAVFDIFNLGESATTSVNELIGMIEAAVGRKAVVNRLPERPGDVPRTYADISKARRELGYQPATPITEGIPRYVDWYLSTLAGGVPSQAGETTSGGRSRGGVVKAPPAAGRRSSCSGRSCASRASTPRATPARRTPGKSGAPNLSPNFWRRAARGRNCARCCPTGPTSWAASRRIARTNPSCCFARTRTR